MATDQLVIAPDVRLSNRLTRVERFRRTDGLDLVADVGGEALGPTVILLHGGGQTRHSWSGASQALLEQGFRVISFDARGHGDSDWSPDGHYSMQSLADDLTSIIHIQCQRPALVGASMGGIAALRAIVNAKEQIASALVMVDIVPQLEVTGVSRIVGFLRGHLNGFATLEEAAAAVSAYNPHRHKPNDSSGLMRNLRRREDGRLHWHWDPRFFAPQNNLEPPHGADFDLMHSQNDKLPVLVVRGMNSDLITDVGVEAFRKQIPQLEVFSVADAGHMVVGDKNDAFNTTIIKFLTTHKDN